MKIHMVSLEDGNTATGCLKVAAYAEKINPDTRVFYVGTRRYVSPWKLFTRTMGETPAFGPKKISEIAHDLSGADIIGDNPVEMWQDVIDTLELIYHMPLPFKLNIFSLHITPNTTLENKWSSAASISHTSTRTNERSVLHSRMCCSIS